MPGQTVCLTRSVKPVSGFANERANSYRASLFSQKIYWRVWSRGLTGKPELTGKPYFWADVRHSLFEKFKAVLSLSNAESLPQARAILAALIFGDRFYLSQETVNNFASATLAHSLALSGQHLGVVGLLGYFLIILLALAWPRIYLACPRMLLVLMASLPLAFLYLWLGNAPPSLQRAAAMLLACAIWFWRRSFPAGIDILCAALFLILMLAPLAIFDIGLQMSALCVAIILLAWPFFAKFLPTSLGRPLTFRERIWRTLASIFLVSFIIQLALLPLTLTRFQQAGFWFPLNVLWLPVLGFIVLPFGVLGLVFAAMPFDFANLPARLALDAAATPCQLLSDMLAYLEKQGILAETLFLVPHWSGLLAFALLITALALLLGVSGVQARNKSRLMLCIALTALAVGPALRLWNSLSDTIRVTALDVGQGEALLVELPGRIRLLMDGGGSSTGRFDPGKAIVTPQTTANAQPKLEAVFNSHPDLDHLGGLLYILGNFAVADVFHNGRSAQKSLEQTWKRIRNWPNAHIPAAGDELQLGRPEDGLFLEFLHPPANNPVWSGNGASLVLRLVRHGKGIALFPGDADKAVLHYLLDNNVNLQAQVVIAPHHGSDKDMLAEFYKAARPELVIACCGYLNFRHYPGKKTRSFLAANGIQLLDTGNHGKISVEFDINGKMEIEAVKKMTGERL